MCHLRSKLIVLLIYTHCVWMSVTRVTCKTVPGFQQEYINDEHHRRGDEDSIDLLALPTQDPEQKAFQEQSKSVNNFHDGSRLPGTPKVKFVDQCSVTYSVEVNCSARDLYTIPTTDFPIGILVYDLSRNHIISLPSNAFTRYSLLRVLILQRNAICKIDPLAFAGLSNLESLDLYSNKLIMNNITLQNAFSEKVFAPLSKLRTLRLEGNNLQPNNKALRYPHKALSHLASLEELSLDGLVHAVFGKGFGNLTSLKNLSLEGFKGGKCQLTGLQNETFQHVTPVEVLRINNCNLKGNLIQNGAFLPLKNLKHLYIGFNPDINVQFFDRVFFGLQNTTTLKSLHMPYVVNQYTFSICLSSQYIKYFPQSVEYLDIKENQLECIDRNVIDKIKNLKAIDIGKNDFVFGTYFQDLPKLTQLTTLYIDNKVLQAKELPRNYPYYSSDVPPLDTGNCSIYARKGQEIGGGELTIQLPPNLVIVKMRYTRVIYTFSRLKFNDANSLRNIRLEGNYIPYLKGPILGLNRLEILHFAFNNIERMSENFFKPLSSLQYLNLSSNSLGSFFHYNKGTQVFHALTNLQCLDLSSNAIRTLGKNIFQGMTELRKLVISHNPIYHFHPYLYDQNKLEAFIAVDTSLSFLYKDTRDVISRRLAMGYPFCADLEDSPIVCDCENLQFLKWMVTSGAFTFKSKEYRCYYPDTSSIKIHDGYSQTLYQLSRECISKQSLFYAVGVGTVVFVMIIVCSVIYRYRWKLRYLYHAAYISLPRGRESRSANNFDYDVFLCYAEEDRHFVMDMLCPALETRGVSVFLHHRHFAAGELIGSNIVRAVNACRRTVVVLTRTLIQSSWCNYEIQMANMETAQRGKPVLIFLLLGGLVGREMGNELLYNVQNNTYIPFPSESINNENALNALFDKLAKDIRE